MATTRTLETISATFDRWGIPYLDDDVMPGHPRGAFTPRFVMLHDTVGSSRGPEPSHRIVREGRPPTVPPPLYHMVLRRDLVVDLVTYGRANHAGKGGPWRPRTSGEGIPKDLGNRLSVGISWEHTGHPGDEWLPEFVAFGVLVTAATCEHFSIPAAHVLGHKEYTHRKIDPVDLLMGDLRARVDGMMLAGPQPGPTEQEDDMQTSDTIKLGPANAAALRQPDREVTVGEALVGTWASQVRTERSLGELTTKLDALLEALKPKDTP